MKSCTQCGKCCINYSDGGLSASAEEITLWEQFRPEIARYVRGGRIWMHPESGEQLTRCPWLSELSEGRYGCSIYHDRPEDCRHYPVTIDQMIEDDCEMLEVQDLRDHDRAQKTLDAIMADSRPPLEPGVR